MAGTKVNNYSNIDTNIQALQLTTDKVFKGLHQLTLTEMNTSTVPAIAAGSVVECNGTLIKYDTEEAIVTTDPHTSATVADGAVYIVIKGSDLTVYFTATAPTWSDAKQGYYGLTTWANDRYVGNCTKATASYTYKYYIKDQEIKHTKSRSQLKATGNVYPSQNTWSNPAFDVITYDINNELTGLTTFTAKKDGYYWAYANIDWQLLGEEDSVCSIAIYKNGSFYSKIFYDALPTREVLQANCGDLLYLTAGDTIRFYFFNSHVGSFSVIMSGSTLTFVEL